MKSLALASSYQSGGIFPTQKNPIADVVSF